MVRPVCDLPLSSCTWNSVSPGTRSTQPGAALTPLLEGITGSVSVRRWNWPKRSCTGERAGGTKTLASPRDASNCARRALKLLSLSPRMAQGSLVPSGHVLPAWAAGGIAHCEVSAAARSASARPGAAE
jgi:hypothetical protein